MDISRTLFPILIVPIILIIITAVYMGTMETTATTFEETVVNDSIGTGASSPQTLKTTYDCKEDTLTNVYNGTAACAVTTCYNVTYDPLGKCSVTTKAQAGAIKVSYTGYGSSLTSDAYSAFEKVNTQTYAGFKLGSLLPYAMMAMVVLTVLIGAFAL